MMCNVHISPLSNIISQQGPPGVPIASVRSSSTGTDLAVPDVDVDILVEQSGAAQWSQISLLPSRHSSKPPTRGLGRNAPN